MTKKVFSISLACILLAFAACKKSSTDIIAPSTVVPKVKTFTIMNGAAILNGSTIDYDNMDRRIKQTDLNGAWFDFTFSGSTMVQEQFNSNGVSQSKITYTLNANGTAASYYINASPAIVTNLTYNSANQPVTAISNNNGVITSTQFYEYDNAGNRIKDSLVQASGTIILTYEFYTDKISTLSNINFGDFVNGAGNKNCTKILTVKNSANLTTIYNYTIPETDAQGRVTKQSYTVGANTVQYTYTYY